MRRSVRRIGPPLAMLALGLLPATPAPCASADTSRKVMVLGIDGLDPKLLQRFADEGQLPNFSKLMREGSFKPLQTSMPPMSPIAWSTFITGMDPGGHGIFDFIHRDPKTLVPYMSMSKAEPPDHSVALGSWVLPIGSGRVDNLRKGKAFWQFLEDAGVDTTIYKIPANFPPVESGGRSLSGMGTPDIRGTPGTFSYYSDVPLPNARDITGGEAYVVRVEDNHVRSKLYGPPNPFRRVEKKRPRSRRRREPAKIEYENPVMTVDFDVWLDPQEPVAQIKVGDHVFVLKEGEWSDWVPVSFEAVPHLVSVASIGRFYLKEVRPEFKLYVTPLQIDPADPAMPISTPSDWSAELAEKVGEFYTQELPEDTKAFTHGVFTGREFWTQSQMVLHETDKALDYLLDHWDHGLLFFYFSSVDQGCHMLWQYFDPKHPGYVDDPFLKDAIPTLYREMDDALGRVMAKIDDDTTLIVMSDHGFGPFYRQVNLNTYLLEKGYVVLKDPARQGQYPFFANVDWSKTRAYALGLNGLYVNLKGREEHGIVDPSEYDALLDDLQRDLLALRDPENGEPAITLVTRTHRAFHGPYVDIGPDIEVGYNATYRSSWRSPLGEFPKQVFEDNLEAWSADHCIDYRLVPGVLLTNREITMDKPSLLDLTVAILDEYGVPKPANMIGRDCLGGKIEPAVAAVPKK